MGTFGSGERYDDNPFVFMESSEYVINPQSQQDMPNPLRAMYEDLAPLLIRSPPSKRYPQQPTGRKGWDVLTDPISELILTSAVPDPILGETLQRVMRPTVEGKQGLATHLNILVDCSGSMGDYTIYGLTATGFPMAGYHLAQVCTAMMIAQAEIAKDTFAVWGFNDGGFIIWDGPSGEHNMAIDYFLDNVPESQSPFLPDNYTNIYAGINQVGIDLESFSFDQCVTIVIMDDAVRNKSAVKKQMFNDNMQYTDKQLREMGPVFYVFLTNEAGEENAKESVKMCEEVFAEEYGRDMKGFFHDFVVTVGPDGSVKSFAGTLCDMARVNSGDSDLGEQLGIDSAEEAAENSDT